METWQTRTFVQTYDKKPKRRIFELLKEQGMQMNQQVKFFSDGGAAIRNMQLYLNPEEEQHFGLVPCHDADHGDGPVCQGVEDDGGETG